jgi:hypothetical protein
VLENGLSILDHPGKGQRKMLIVATPPVKKFDRQAGVDETSTGLYHVVSGNHLWESFLEMIGGDERSWQERSDASHTTTVFLAEALKPKDTGKHTPTREMTKTGVWSERDTHEASAQSGREDARLSLPRPFNSSNDGER